MSFKGFYAGETANASISGHGITTDDFTLLMGFWKSATNSSWENYVTLAQGTGASPTNYFRIASPSGSDQIIVHHNGARYCDTNGAGGYAPSMTTNYWLVLSRSGTALRLRVFDGESLNTTPLYDDTDTMSDSLSLIDSIIIGESATGEGFAGQAWNVKLYGGAEMTNAECIAEMQKFAMQKTGGTKFCWGLEAPLAGRYGTIEYHAGNVLTNSGFIYSATSRSSKLEVAQMAAILYTTVAETGLGGSNPISGSLSMTTGRFYVAALCYSTNNGGTNSVTDSLGNTWNRVASSNSADTANNHEAIEFWWCLCTTGGGATLSNTVTGGSGSDWMGLYVTAFINPPASIVVSAATGVTNGSGSSAATASMNTTYNSMCIVAITANPTMTAPAAPWVTVVNNTATNCVGVAYQNVLAAGTIAGSWTNGTTGGYAFSGMVINVPPPAVILNTGDIEDVWAPLFDALF